MVPRSQSLAEQGSLFATRQYLWALLFVTLPGCQMPAAHFTAPTPEDFHVHRHWTLAQQVAADSSLELAHHPLRCSWNLVHGATCHVWATTDGELSKRLLLPLQGTPPPLTPCDMPTAGAGWDARQAGIVDRELQPADIQLYPGGKEALAALEQLIDSATHSIDVLMFEWEDDAVGGAIAARLAARAGPHLRVRVLEDGGGNLIFGRPMKACAAEVNRALCALSQQPYVEVRRCRNPFCRFDHRKVVLIDGRIAWSGGRNFVKRVFFDQHDLSFTFAGPLAAEMQAEFDAYWEEQGGPCTLHTAKHAPEVPPPAAAPLPPGTVNAWAHMVYTKPGNYDLQKTLYRAVDRAKYRIHAENVYFCDSRLIYKLAQARRRGVDVRVILTVSSTNCVINCSNRVTANRLLRAGVRVYLYPGMTHVKAAAVDGCWAYIGTANFDALSLRRNYEMGLAIGAGPIIQELENRIFLPDSCPDWELKVPLPISATDYAFELVCCVWL